MIQNWYNHILNPTHNITKERNQITVTTINNIDSQYTETFLSQKEPLFIEYTPFLLYPYIWFLEKISHIH